MIGSVTRPRFAPTLGIPNTVSITPETLIQRIPLNYNGDGVLDVSSTNTNVEPRIEGNDLVLTGRKSGTAQVTVRGSAGFGSKMIMGGLNKCNLITDSVTYACG